MLANPRVVPPLLQELYVYVFECVYERLKYSEQLDM